MNFTKLPVTVNNIIANKILQVVSVFENGSKDGNYATLVVYRDFLYQDNFYKQITYGRFQTTEFGNLKKLIQMYIEQSGEHANEFKEYVSSIGLIKNGTPQSLNTDTNFINFLKKAGEEDVMKTVQEKFFDLRYFLPSVEWAITNQFTEPLSLLVIFDSFIHSGGIRNSLRKKFPEYPPSLGGNEKEWIKQYVETRHAWLKNYQTDVVRMSAYRTKTLLQLIEDDNWDLTKPFKTQGVQF